MLKAEVRLNHIDLMSKELLLSCAQHVLRPLSSEKTRFRSSSGPKINSRVKELHPGVEVLSKSPSNVEDMKI